MQILDPTATPGGEASQGRHVMDTLAGKTIGFIDNAKPNFNHLVDDIADELLRRHGVAKVLKRG